MKRLILSTDNKNKALEIKGALEGPPLEVYIKSGLIDKEIQVNEKYNGLEENARLKAKSLREYTPECFILADDTGLFIHALEEEPGVHSARHAGSHDDEANIKKVLKNLKDQEDRSACFKTVSVLINPKGQEEIIGGVCEGTILKEIQGPKTLGYDPVFQPDGKNISFAEVTIHGENGISHRSRVLVGFREYFKKVLRQDKKI